MSEPQTTYYWKVHFRNDKQGFQKVFEVVAPVIFSAITEAVATLIDLGYNESDFNVMSAQRIREVGT